MNNVQSIIAEIQHGRRCFIIKGAAGTGKTTLIRSLVPALRAQGFHPALMAPTGGAAMVLGKRTGCENRRSREDGEWRKINKTQCFRVVKCVSGNRKRFIKRVKKCPKNTKIFARFLRENERGAGQARVTGTSSSVFFYIPRNIPSF